VAKERTVAIILFRCPFCGKKVETSEDNVGREGLCPGCQKIFEIPEPSKREPVRPSRAGMLADGPPEYQELAVLIGVGLVVLGLAGLAATTFLPWLQPWATQVQAVGQQKAYILLGSAACLAFTIVSGVTRKSLMPPVLTGAGWGMFSLIWIGTIWRTVGKATEGSSQSATATGIFLAMAACLAALGGAAFVYYQVRDGAMLERFGLFLVATQVIAVALALVLASHRLKPALTAPPAPAPAVQEVQRPRAARPAPVPVAEDGPPAEETPGE
jgi:hypothetical protein